MADVMITTVDNPYSPFDQYDQWWNYDFLAGWHTNERLASFAPETNALQSDAMYDEDVLIAMYKLVSFMPEVYKIVSRDEKTPGEGSE